jgi:hypothetical protein
MTLLNVDEIVALEMNAIRCITGTKGDNLIEIRAELAKPDEYGRTHGGVLPRAIKSICALYGHPRYDDVNVPGAYIIDRETFTRFCKDTEAVVWEGCPDDLMTFDELLGMFDEMSMTMSDYIKYVCGLHIHNDRVYVSSVTDGADTLHMIESICNLVSGEYDSPTKTCKASNMRMWDVLGLGGDDDVDYNSSYIITGIQHIRMFLNWAHPSKIER